MPRLHHRSNLIMVLAPHRVVADDVSTRASDELRRLGELLQQRRKTDTRKGWQVGRKESMVDVMEVPYDRFRDGQRLSPGVTTRDCR